MKIQVWWSNYTQQISMWHNFFLVKESVSQLEQNFLHEQFYNNRLLTSHSNVYNNMSGSLLHLTSAFNTVCLCYILVRCGYQNGIITYKHVHITMWGLRWNWPKKWMMVTTKQHIIVIGDDLATVLQQWEITLCLLYIKIVTSSYLVQLNNLLHYDY